MTEKKEAQKEAQKEEVKEAREQPVAERMAKLTQEMGERVERDMLRGMLRAGADCQKGLQYSVGYFMTHSSYETPNNPLSGFVSMLTRCGLDLERITKAIETWDLEFLRNWIWENVEVTVLSDKLRRVFDAYPFDRAGYAEMRREFRKIGADYLDALGKNNVKTKEVTHVSGKQ